MTEHAWQMQCPARGYGLKHAHMADCPDGHKPNQCCECEGFPFDPPTARPTQVMPPLDVDARLRMMGLMPERRVEETEMEDIREDFDHDDDVLVEPRLALGEWKNGTYVPGELTGRRDGRGRGDLTPTMKKHLLLIDEQERWLDERARR